MDLRDKTIAGKLLYIPQWSYTKLPLLSIPISSWDIETWWTNQSNFNKSLYYITLGTSVINSAMSPPSLSENKHIERKERRGSLSCLLYFNTRGVLTILHPIIKCRVFWSLRSQ